MNNWVGYALISFVAYFFVNFSFKFISANKIIPVTFMTYVFAVIIMFFVLLSTKHFFLDFKSLLIAAIIAVGSVAGTIFMIKSVGLAPNPGYGLAIASANVVVIALISPIVFHSSLTLPKILGVFLTFLGVILLSI